MEMNNALKWVLIAGAGYLVYRYLAEQGLMGLGPSVPAEDEEAAPGEAEGEGNGAAASVTTKSVLYTKALQSMPSEWEGELNADQWNYFYTAVSGVQQTVELHPPGDRGALMTVDEYFDRRAEKGLTGLGRLSPWVWVT